MEPDIDLRLQHSQSAGWRALTISESSYLSGSLTYFIDLKRRKKLCKIPWFGYFANVIYKKLMLRNFFLLAVLVIPVAVYAQDYRWQQRVEYVMDVRLDVKTP